MRTHPALTAGASLVLLGLATASTAAASPGSATRPAPRLTVSATKGSPGGTVTVNGYGLAKSAVFTVQICGDDARGGSVDCALASARTVTSSATGWIVVVLPVVKPPAPCPCVISTLSTDLTTTLARPFRVVGARVAPLTPLAGPPPGPTLVLQSATLRGSTSRSSWFGGSAHQTLILSVSNTGAQPVSAPPVVLTIDPMVGSSQSLASPALGELPAHSSRTYDIPVRIGAISAGHYRVKGSLGFAGNQVAFAATTDVVPWGLLAVVALVAQLGLLAARNRLRRRIHAGGRHRASRPATPVESPQTT
jgi:hypothetical protein